MKFLVNKIAVYFAKYEFCRLIGMRVYSESLWQDFKIGGLKLFIESYFDLAMCSLLNVLAFFEKRGGKYDFYDFWQTRDDIVCSILAIVYAIIIMAFPFYGYKQITKNFKQLSRKEVQMTIGIFYEDNRTNTEWRALYNIFFLYRRMFSVGVLVYIENYPFFQTTLLTSFSSINFIYLFVNNPLLSKK